MLGVIVGPIAEIGFVRGRLLTGQEPMSFATNSSISIVLIAFIVLFWPSRSTNGVAILLTNAE
ncbi:hypothetical protein [Halopiger aswanensis]|uniref:Uncharacterized protein n=1 Tax=Halopiger aswanensis TaxID=148449 RepID=A0A419VUQ2_9EURY|nr:hypothetical protein [Halopiger aswanensis]RKD85917.1 hypothetical protein ATJ93_4689 [Halopiger aswanensis]